MKRILFSAFCLALGLFYANGQIQPSVNPVPNDTANYPYWIEMMRDPTVNFFQVQRAFNLYWENRPITRASGWKPFKRWEYMMRLRIRPDGTIPPADETFQAFQKMHRGVQTAYGSWVSLGPSQIPAPGPAGYEGLGRLNVVAFHPTDPNKLYVGAPAGGMWQSTDGGNTWVSHTDSLATLGVSAIVVDRVNPNTIYIGTGDRDAGDAPGMGVFKSPDHGLTWAPWNTGMGNKIVGKLLQDPVNAQILLAATNGGIFRTTNGGQTWTLSVSGNFRDLQFRPANSNIVYAGGDNGIFYRSSNNGVSFTQITNGLPGGQRSVIGVSPANPDWVYVLMSNGSSGFQGVYRSVDAGLTFTTRSTQPNILDWSCDGSGGGGQGWYDLAIAVNPNNASEVFVGGVNVWRSLDGGAQWTINSHWYGGCSVPAVHADCHFLGYSNVNGKLYAGNDGGIYSTNNSGTNWTDHTVGMTIGQIYKLGQGQMTKQKVINGFQDNGTYTYIGSGWVATGGGDGMECAVDYSNSAYAYHTIYYGDIFRRYNNGSEWHVAGNGMFGITESGSWVTPFQLHVNTPTTMFVGFKNVWRCTNIRNYNDIVWTKISDLGNTDMAVLEQSPADPDIMYAANYGNKLFRSDNCNGANPSWLNLTSNLPASGTPTDFAAHPTNPNVVFMTLGNSVYKSTNKGISWTNISGNLTGIHLNTIAYYRNATEGLYVGSDAGVYYKDSTMTQWINYSAGLPVNGRVTEVEIYYDNDSVSEDAIRACTYGRGLWGSGMYHGNPSVNFTADKTLIPVNCGINFTDLSSGVPTYFQWTFTGATPSTSTLKNPSNIIYPAPGTYPVKLKIWNENGADSMTKVNYITVSSTLLPSVDFTSDKRTLCGGDVVHFTDLSGNCPATWVWSFSPNTVTFVEGTSALSRNPVVAFNVQGNYSVTLTVTNGVGPNSLTRTDYILNGGYSLPFSEDFETGLGTKEWTIINSDMAKTWDTITVGGTQPGQTAVWMNFFGYPNIGKRDQLVSAPLNLAGFTEATLNFQHAYAQRSSLKDSLIVYVADSCGKNWTRIFATGPDGTQGAFVTHPPTMDPFYPETSGDWCGSGYGVSCYTLDMSPWAGQENIKIMFESYNGRSNNLFIDNISITGIVGTKEREGKAGDIRVFPNPSDGTFNVCLRNGATACAVELFTVQGQRILFEKWGDLPAGTTKQLHPEPSAPGIYYLRISEDGTIKVVKLLIE